MIVNGVILDKKGNLVRKKKSRSISTKNPYRKVKSKFKEHLEHLAKDGKRNNESGKTFKLNSDSHEISNNLNNVRKKLSNKRGRFYTEGDNSYLLNLINKRRPIS